MSGYRDHSFDPNVYEQPGRPLRPFNWVQWTGIAIGSAGILLSVLHWLGELGWIAQRFEALRSSFVLLLIGAALVNSRREPTTMIDYLQRDRNRKLLLITVAICATILGAALVTEF